MDDKDPGVTIPDCSIIKESDKAILVEMPSVGQVWVPKSQLHDNSEIWKEGSKGDLTVTTWFAEKRGWD